MSLHDLQTALRRNLQDTSLRLSDDLLGTPFLNALFHNPVLTLEQASLEPAEELVPADGTLTLRGVATVLQTAAVAVEFALTQADEVLAVDFQAAFPAGATFGIPGLPLDGATLRLTQTGAGKGLRRTGALNGSTGAGPFSLGLALPTEDSGGNWSLAARFEGDQLASLVRLLASAGDVATQLPVADLTLLRWAEAQFSFDPLQHTLGSMAFNLAAPPWQVIDRLAIHDLQVMLQVAYPGDPGRRAISLALSGAATVAGVDLPVAISRNGASGDWDLRLSSSPTTVPFNLADLLAAFGGADLPAALPAEIAAAASLALGDLHLVFNPAAQPPAGAMTELSLLLYGAWDLAPGKFSISDAALRLSVADPADAARRQIGGGIAGTVTIGGTSFALAAEHDRAAAGAAPWTFSGGLLPGMSVSFTTLAAALLPGGLTLPPEVPDFKLSGLDVAITPATGAFTVDGTCAAAWELPFGVPGLVAGTTRAHIERGPSSAAGGQTVSGAITAWVKLDCTGPVTVVEGLDVNALALKFNYGGAGEGQGAVWQLTGNLAAALFDRRYDLQAGLVVEPARLRFTFTEDIQAPAALRPLVDLGSVGSLTGSRLAIDVSRARVPAALPQPETDRVKLQATSQYTWAVSAAGRVAVLDSFTFDGTLALHGRPDGIALALKPGSGGSFAEIDVPLSIQDSSAAHLGLDFLDFSATKTNGARAWAVSTATRVWFSGLPAAVQSYLPTSGQDDVRGTFEAGTGEGGARVAFTIAPLLKLQPFTLPSIDVDGITIDLSRAKSAFGVGALQVSWNKGQQGSVSAEFSVGIPAELNQIFGTRGGRPVVDLFAAYDENNPASAARFRLAATAGGSKALGLEIQPLTSPFKKLTLTPAGPGGQGRQCVVDLDTYGTFSFVVPSFAYDGQNFRSAGGFTQRNLALPLSPLKSLLAAMGLGAARRWLPDSLPLEELPIYDQATGAFNVDLFFDKFIAPLEALAGVKLLPDAELRAALRLVGDQADRLPDRFKRYLDIVVPSQLYYQLAVSDQGGLLGNISVYPPGQAPDKRQNTTPIRFLIPGVAVTGPVLTGVELWSLSVGEVLGGALLLVKADFNVDQYDLLTLAAALGLPAASSALLPPTQQLTKRLIVDHLVMLVVPEVPLPVPLFFNELGLEYLGIEGLNLQAHLGFPEPQVDLKEALQLFQDFKKYFTDKDALLDEGQLGGVIHNMDPAMQRKLDLELTLGPLFLGLPAYLGGSKLGSPTDTYTVSLLGNLAYLLNAMKKLNASDLVRAIPEQYRRAPQQPAARPQVSFGPLIFTADWLIAAPPGDAHGVLLNINGSAGLPGVAELKAALAVQMSSLAGFAGSFTVDGAINGLLQMHLAGSLAVNAALPPAANPGSTRMPSFAAGRAVMPGPAWQPQAFTVEWWLYPTSRANYNQVIAGGDAWGGFAWHTTITGAVYAGTDVPSRFTPVDLPDGTVELHVWQHFAFTFDHGTARCYKNGLLLATRTGVANPAPWTGVRLGWTYPNSQMDGSCVEVRVWDHARSGSELAADMLRRLAGNEPGLVGYWPLDDGAGASGLAGGGPAALSQVTWLATSLARPLGLSFPDQGAPLVLPGPRWQPHAFTVEWWAYPRSHSDYNQALAGGDAWGGFVCHTTATGAIYAGTDQYTRFTPADLGDGTLQLDTWQHLAFAYDNGTAHFYRDGRLLATKTGLAAPAAWQGFHLGTSDPHGRLDGIYAGVRIWNSALPAETVRANRFTRLSGREAGLVAYWPLDEGTGTTVHDLGPAGFNGALNGQTWARPGADRAAADLLKIAGQASLTVLDHQIFNGEVQVTDSSFRFLGTLDLFPDNAALRATGRLAGVMDRQHFLLAGDAAVALAGFKLVSGTALISNERVHLAGQWLGIMNANLDVRNQNGKISLAGAAGFSMSLSPHFAAVQMNTPGGRVKLADSFGFTTNATVTLNITVDEAQRFAADLMIGFTLGAQQPVAVNFSIQTAPGSLAELEQQVVDFITHNTDPLAYFNLLFPGAAAWAQGAAHGSFGWAKNAWGDTARVLRYAYGQTTQGAIQVLQTASFDAGQVGAVLGNGFVNGPDELLAAMKQAGFTPGQLGQGLVSGYVLLERDFIAALQRAGLDSPGIGQALHVARGYDGNELILALKDYYQPAEVGSAFYHVFEEPLNNLSLDAKEFETLAAMQRNGYGAPALTQTLQQAFGVQKASDAASQLQRLKVPATDALNAIQTSFALPAKDAAQALVDGGFAKDALDQLGDWFKQTFHLPGL